MQCSKGKLPGDITEFRTKCCRNLLKPRRPSRFGSRTQCLTKHDRQGLKEDSRHWQKKKVVDERRLRDLGIRACRSSMAPDTLG